MQVSLCGHLPRRPWLLLDRRRTNRRLPSAYGPSSAHPAVVVVGMGDGSTQSLSKRTDAANLFFLITKNNSDPFYIP